MVNKCISCFKIVYHSPIASYIEHILNETNIVILISMAIPNLIFNLNSCYHRFIPSVEVEKQTLPQLKVRGPRKKDEDSEIRQK
eukprot:UN04254